MEIVLLIFVILGIIGLFGLAWYGDYKREKDDREK